MSGIVIILYRNYIKRNEYWKLLTKNDSSDPLKKHFTIHKLETTTIRTSISQIKKKKKRIFSLHFHILFITSRSFFSFYKLQDKQRGTIISFFTIISNLQSPSPYNCVQKYEIVSVTKSMIKIYIYLTIMKETRDSARARYCKQCLKSGAKEEAYIISG